VCSLEGGSPRIEVWMKEMIKIKCEKCETIFRVDHDILIANSAICPKCGVLNTKCGFPAMTERH